MAQDQPVTWSDVQGLVLSGYPRLTFAAYIPWRFLDPLTEQSRVWLKGLTERLMRADKPVKSPSRAEPGQPSIPTNLTALKAYLEDFDDANAINVALTWSGLQKLGAPIEEFSAEFVEGMVPNRGSDASLPRRCNILGDVGKNSPEYWQWGGWDANGKIDGVLMLYAKGEKSLNELIKEEMGQMRGVEFLQPVAANPGDRALILKGSFNERFEEHFGFMDGISQPLIRGTPGAPRGKGVPKDKRMAILADKTSAKEVPKDARMSIVAPGEFLLGYLNERETRAGYSDVPDQGGQSKARDFRLNGTYLVFRQLEQNLAAFSTQITNTAKLLRGSDSEDDKKWVAAKMMGRKQNGDPLIPAPTGPVEQKNQQRRTLRTIRETLAGRVLPRQEVDPSAKRNDFLYFYEDRFGLRCPLGAHIRRANPRDSSLSSDPNTALRLSRMHRIIRRGRPYGKRSPYGPYSKQFSEKKNEKDRKEQRGILFICLNADIAGQFELIQHSWINNGRFAGLYGETDPIMHSPGEDRLMTIQRRPTSDCVGSTQEAGGLEQFVTVRGGAYFFMPGIKALKALAGDA